MAVVNHHPSCLSRCVALCLQLSAFQRCTWSACKLLFDQWAMCRTTNSLPGSFCINSACTLRPLIPTWSFCFVVHLLLALWTGSRASSSSTFTTARSEVWIVVLCASQRPLRVPIRSYGVASLIDVTVVRASRTTVLVVLAI